MLIGYFEPYKDFKGTIEYSILNGYHGKIICDDLITYEAENAMQLYKKFKYAVNDYIEFKEEIKND